MKNLGYPSSGEAAAFDLEEVKIPKYLFDGEKRIEEDVRIPQWPMLIFVNTKSGSQTGVALLQTLHRALNPQQVFDVGKDRPEDALQRVFRNIEKLTSERDEVAEEIRKKLRIVVAGGDGTAGWLIGVVGDLRLESPPPIATIPFGTGNNIPFSFGWGKKNPGTDVEAVKGFLKEVVEAYPMNLDSWHVSLAMESGRDLGPEAPVPLHVFKRSDAGSKEQSEIYRAGFWNYFSMGMDGHVAYSFHKMRQENPDKFKNQLNNQLTYGKLVCSQGWFFASCWHPVSRNINEVATIYIAERDGPWKELKLPSSIRSVVMLNLPSFSGGLNPWGKPSEQKSSKRGLRMPSVNDGLLELVGFKDAWHGLTVLFPHGHGNRLAQAHRVRIHLKPAANKQTYMHIDGEPWAQPLPDLEHGSELEVSHHGQAIILARKGCIAENRDAYQHTISFTKHGIEHGLHAKPTPPHKHHRQREMSQDVDEDGDETKQKFGASSALRD